MSKRLVPAKEYRDVVSVAATYVDALRRGDIDMLGTVFHPGSVTYGTVNGELVGSATTNPAISFIQTYGPSPDIDAHIDVLDITPTTAVVRVTTEKDAVGSDCSENLLLIRLASGWTIMAKVFHQFDM